MKKSTKTIAAIALSAAVLTPAFAAATDNSVTKFDRNDVVSTKADKTLEHVWYILDMPGA
jgi:hypothetical protein